MVLPHHSSAVLPGSRAYSQTYSYCTENKWMYIVFLLVNMSINAAFGGIPLCPTSHNYHSIRNVMAACDKNHVDSKLAPVLNRPKKCTLKDHQLKQKKRKQ